MCSFGVVLRELACRNFLINLKWKGLKEVDLVYDNDVSQMYINVSMSVNSSSQQGSSKCSLRIKLHNVTWTAFGLTYGKPSDFHNIPVMKTFRGTFSKMIL